VRKGEGVREGERIMGSEGGLLGPRHGLWVVVVGTHSVFVMLVYHLQVHTAVHGGGRRSLPSVGYSVWNPWNPSGIIPWNKSIWIPLKFHMENTTIFVVKNSVKYEN